MLHKEYYPDDNILMDEELQNKMKDMADFIVAYENILRDGQRTTDNMVDIEGLPIVLTEYQYHLDLYQSRCSI